MKRRWRDQNRHGNFLAEQRHRQIAFAHVNANAVVNGNPLERISIFPKRDFIPRTAAIIIVSRLRKFFLRDLFKFEKIERVHCSWIIPRLMLEFKL